MDGDSGQLTVENEVAGVGEDESERVVGARLSETSRELVPETRQSILKGTVFDPQGGCLYVGDT